MCFSAEVSFTAASVILIAGVTSVRKVYDKKQLMFASIPFIFAIQQFTEGFLWIAFKNDAYSDWKNLLTHLFIFFAQVVWPFWVPLAFCLIEKDIFRKKILGSLTIIGGGLSLVLLYCLIMFSVTSVVTDKHIYYQVTHLGFSVLGAILYFTVTVFPPFVSRLKFVWLLGILNLISFLISKIFFNEHVISVWCFMAALISVLVVMVMKEEEEATSRNSPSSPPSS